MSEPTETPVEAELATWGDDRVFLDPMWGNHGDQMIVMGSEAALAASGVRRVDDVRDADRIVVKGGGYRVGGGWLAHIAEVLGRADGVPVMIMPATFEDPAGIVALLDRRRGSGTIYFREAVSYELAKAAGASSVDLRLDHDMAFRLEGSVYVRQLRGRSHPKTLLIVERTDAETVSGRRARALGPAWIKSRIPESVKLRVKRRSRQIAARRRGSTTPFASAVHQSLVEHRPDYADLPVVAGDISRVDFCTFDQFGDYVANAAVVVTSRLHVGILAALLGKETYLVPGVYHKMVAVYERSLVRTKGIHLADSEFFAS